jgi:hypothetical protein
MAKDRYKILLFMKRRPGMTFEAFQDYYENHHAPLCEKYTSAVSRYLRRFLTPHPNPETGATEELQFDVITELWFEDEATFRGTVEYLARASCRMKSSKMRNGCLTVPRRGWQPSLSASQL